MVGIIKEVKSNYKDGTLYLMLPWPVSVNHLYIPGRRRTKKGKIYTGRILDPKAAAYKKLVAWHLLIQKAHSFGEDVCAINIHMHPPSKRSYDFDNFNKLLCDVLAVSGIVDNDKQFYRANVLKYDYDERFSGVLVKIVTCNIPYFDDNYMEDIACMMM